MDQPYVSVIIPTRGRPERLSLTLLSLALQDYPREQFEIVVVDDALYPKTSRVISKLALRAKIRSIRGPNQGRGSARNIGINEARGELLVFVDDDVICGRDFIAQHICYHRDPQKDFVVTGIRRQLYVQVPGTDESWLRNVILIDFDKVRRRSYPDYHCGLWDYVFTGDKSAFASAWICLMTCNFSVRANTIRRVGMFDPALTFWEDAEIGLRLKRIGVDFRYSKAATNYHLEHDRDLCFRRKAWQNCLIYFRKKHGHVVDILEMFFLGRIGFDAFDKAMARGIVPQPETGKKKYGSYWLWEALALSRWPRTKTLSNKRAVVNGEIEKNIHP